MTKLPFTSYTLSTSLPPQARAPFRPFRAGEAYNVVTTPYSVGQRQTGWSQAVVELYVFLASGGGGRGSKSEDPCRKKFWVGLLFSRRESSPPSEMQGSVYGGGFVYVFCLDGAYGLCTGERCMFLPIFCWMRWFYIHTCLVYMILPSHPVSPRVLFSFFFFVFWKWRNETNLDIIEIWSYVDFGDGFYGCYGRGLNVFFFFFPYDLESDSEGSFQLDGVWKNSWINLMRFLLFSLFF